MAREVNGYRDMLELLMALYPGRTALKVPEAAAALGVHTQTITAAINRKKDPLPAQNVSGGSRNKSYVIPIPALAKWQCGGV